MQVLGASLTTMTGGASGYSALPASSQMPAYVTGSQTSYSKTNPREDVYATTSTAAVGPPAKTDTATTTATLSAADEKKRTALRNQYAPAIKKYPDSQLNEMRTAILKKTDWRSVPAQSMQWLADLVEAEYQARNPKKTSGRTSITTSPVMTTQTTTAITTMIPVQGSGSQAAPQGVAPVAEKPTATTSPSQKPATAMSTSLTTMAPVQGPGSQAAPQGVAPVGQGYASASPASSWASAAAAQSPVVSTWQSTKPATGTTTTAPAGPDKTTREGYRDWFRKELKSFTLDDLQAASAAAKAGASWKNATAAQVAWVADIIDGELTARLPKPAVDTRSTAEKRAEAAKKLTALNDADLAGLGLAAKAGVGYMDASAEKVAEIADLIQAEIDRRAAVSQVAQTTQIVQAAVEQGATSVPEAQFAIQVAVQEQAAVDAATKAQEKQPEEKQPEEKKKKSNTMVLVGGGIAAVGLIAWAMRRK